MIPAHKYRNREFMPHEFQLIHNSMAFALKTLDVLLSYDNMTLLEKEMNSLGEAMKILESKR